MQITVISADENVVTALAHDAPSLASEYAKLSPAASFEVIGPERTPGAMGTWWQLAVDLGFVSAPVSVVCNLIASWIWSAKKSPPPRSSPDTTGPAMASDVLLVLRHGDKVAEVQIEHADMAAVSAAIEAAFLHVHS
jgi:hypothetical protein